LIDEKLELKRAEGTEGMQVSVLGGDKFVIGAGHGEKTSQDGRGRSKPKHNTAIIRAHIDLP